MIDSQAIIGAAPDVISADAMPWWWTFTDIELSKIASHLAAGGSLCCEQNADARAIVTKSKRKQYILAEHAYEAWGCYGGMATVGGVLKFSGAQDQRAHAGVGPWFWSTGKPYSKKEADRRREDDLKKAAAHFAGFLEDIGGAL